MDNSEDRCCNTCGHYDPMEGVCGRDGANRRGYDGEDCSMWDDWEKPKYWGKGKNETDARKA